MAPKQLPLSSWGRFEVSATRAAIGIWDRQSCCCNSGGPYTGTVFGCKEVGVAVFKQLHPQMIQISHDSGTKASRPYP